MKTNISIAEAISSRTIWDELGSFFTLWNFGILVALALFVWLFIHWLSNNFTEDNLTDD